MPVRSFALWKTCAPALNAWSEHLDPAIALLMPAGMLAEKHRKMAALRTAE